MLNTKQALREDFYLRLIQLNREGLSKLMAFIKKKIKFEQETLIGELEKALEQLVNTESIHEKESMFQVVCSMISLGRSSFSTNNYKVNYERAQSRIKDIKSWIPQSTVFYLDVGGGDGEITSCIALRKKLHKSNVISLDIHLPTKRFDNITYLDNWDCKELSHRNRYDLITCFESIHHFGEHTDNILHNIYNLLSPRGLLIIREHDVSSEQVSVISYLEWVHLTYTLVNNEHLQSLTPSCYRSNSELEELMIKVGFVKVGCKHLKDMFHNYVAAYKKYIS
jgi:2-polyprenyl-3-methyl-5-hydroxy-6-metoxy-1,4-benzoquinol methylase